MKERGVIMILGLETRMVRHVHHIAGGRIGRHRHAMLDDGTLRHVRHELRRQGLDERRVVGRRNVLQAGALRHIEDMIQAQERNLPVFARFLVFHLF